MAAQHLDLERRLAEELAWRKKEIVELKRAAHNREYLARAVAVVLCAHWEGYLKRAIQVYVDYVFSLNLRVRDLAPNFVAISLYKDVKTAALAEYPGSEQHCIKLSKRLLQGIDVRAPKPKWKVDTAGNPSSEVVVRLLKTAGLSTTLGLAAAEWEATKKFIDEQLLKDRHRIAHGEGFPIQSADVLSRADRLLAMCDTLTRLILDSAVSRAYLALPGEQCAPIPSS